MTKQDWIETVVNWANSGGLNVLGLPCEQYHIHHPAGRTAKHNKKLIGPWWILPIPIRLHDVHSNDPHNVTHHKKAFETCYGSEKQLFKVMVQDMKSRGVQVPPASVQKAIQAWRR